MYNIAEATNQMPLWLGHFAYSIPFGEIQNCRPRDCKPRSVGTKG